ncbi:MAG TPA: hypothetical protein VNL94_05750 [Candidatus Binatia bacterium]|nr:hypothetical protein [Candidatus Binatia bacterium]
MDRFRRTDPRSRRLGAVLLATLVATLLSWSAPGVPSALAAGPLQVRADTTYALDPEAGRVHVATEYSVTNNRPNSATAIFFYRELVFGIQPDVREVRATDRFGALAVTSGGREGFTRVEVRLRSNLFYRQTATFVLRYDLVGAPPRSESPIRIGRAFSTFGVWAFGDPDRSTVTVKVPPGYATTVEGDDMTSTLGGGTTLRAEPADPDAFFAIVTAENRDAYDRERLSLEGGVEVVILSWPEDDAWADTVGETLRDGMPVLRKLVGLDWPVAHDLNVRERYTPALEGYAGVFFLDDQRIDVSEDLDPVTILHEAAHAWFNADLFSARWIYEGLAEEYAYRVLGEIDDVEYDPPTRPDRDDPGFLPLNEWRYPSIVREETDAIELYGYGAAGWLVSMIVHEAGETQMAKAFQDAAANRTAYPGRGDPETVGTIDGWQRFLDLTQPIEEPDPRRVIEAVEEFVLSPGLGDVLERRAAARDAYRELLEAGKGWLPPWFIRNPMGRWQFEEATKRIESAHELLELREQVEATAAAEGLTLGDRLQRAYETAVDGLESARSLAENQLAAARAIAAARAKVDATPDFVAEVGLMGATPRAPLDAARAAFESGDYAGALEQANVAASIVDRAPAVGQERLLLGGAAALVLLLLAVVLHRARRERRRRAEAFAWAAAAPVAAPDPGVAEAPGSSATLGADPAQPAPPMGEAAPDHEGGPTEA